ncbi:MAG: putative nicotinate phosphoribosyltransferase [Verrucomicrobiales bacterium]|nr:putative nicotinate phosphoribosyltransferase [Verrucomicrobiales bacterium]
MATALNLSLLTDLYQLTMAYAHWKSGTGNREAVFHLFFRRNPFKGGFAVACGLEAAIDYLRNFRFESDDLDYLASLQGNDNQPVFERGFLDYLSSLTFTCDIDAIPEGTIVFPHEPLLRVRGPMIQAQVFESALLNIINFQTLIATKAARVCLAAKGDAVLEFGLRRAQGENGAITASRAAYIGGCAATSNVLAGKVYGIPVKGTHAHSWVLAFDSEEKSFREYAKAMPNNCVFLVDTYNTLEGVKKAVKVGLDLRKQGHELAGIRLDSGDLAYLSIEARKILDVAGFPRASIVASSDLDEHVITSLKDQGAQINIWGVGTRLATAYDQPALGGVYKLGAIGSVEGKWDYKVKLSEQAIKTSTPGIQQVRRFRSETEFIGDAIYDIDLGLPADPTIVDPLDMTRRKKIAPETLFEDLLVPVFRKGKLVYQSPALADIRARTLNQLQLFHSGIKRFLNPHQYPVGLELQLHDLKTKLILQAREV